MNKHVIAWAIVVPYLAALAAMFLVGIWSGDERWTWTGLVFLAGAVGIIPPLAALHDPDNN